MMISQKPKFYTDLNLDNLAKSPYVKKIHNISKYDNPTQSFFNDEIYKLHYPVILNNSSKTYIEVSKLNELYGNLDVPLEYSLEEYYRPTPLLNKAQFLRKIVKVKEAISLILNDDDPLYYYLSNLPIKELPELSKFINIPSYFDQGLYLTSVLFLGGDKTGSQLHYDGTENLLELCAGYKKIVLIPRHYSKYLSPISIKYRCCNFSQVDLLDPKIAQKVPKLDVWYCMLKPGEMLYIPSGWWHQVQNEGLSLGISHVWKPKLSDILNWYQIRYRLSLKFTENLSKIDLKE